MRFQASVTLLLALLASSLCFSKGNEQHDILPTLNNKPALDQWLEAPSGPGNVLLVYQTGVNEEETQFLEALVQNVAHKTLGKGLPVRFAKLNLDTADRDAIVAAHVNPDSLPSLYIVYTTRAGLAFEKEYIGRDPLLLTDSGRLQRIVAAASTNAASIRMGARAVETFNDEAWKLNDVSVIGFFDLEGAMSPPTEDLRREYDLFQRAARRLRGQFRFLEVTNKQIFKGRATDKNHDNVHISLFRQVEGIDGSKTVEEVGYPGASDDLDALLYWIHKESLPAFGEWTPDRAPRYEYLNIPIVYLLSAKDRTTPAGKAEFLFHTQLFRELYAQHQGRILFCHASPFDHPDLMVRAGFTGADRAALVMEDRRNHDQIHVYDGPVDAHGVDVKRVNTWLNAAHANAIAPYVKSEPVPEPNPHVPVTRLVGSTFRKFVEDGAKDVVVLLCSHADHPDACPTASEGFYQVAQYFEETYLPTVVFAIVDPALNGVPRTYYTADTPAIMLARAGAKNVPRVFDPRVELSVWVKDNVEIPLVPKSEGTKEEL